MQELTKNEIEQVNGGAVPVIAAGLALASHIGVGGSATTVLGHVMSGAGLALATWSFAEYMME
ncbi:class IIb bacteriocin, lactobin A/cerein 7B family [Shewanella waksmanii]|uniref:class IIb bacteriocin, lactobin A/cerein 7B family n=1 Tax=Shewanella waksmanii TaxID=213783 RepID=UPI00048F056C|nr:class IIb bacteriocin, lactobin A/cerein 7B family [Shewanella waksmanii]